MAFITAGMGGGTGTGAAPVVAEVAKELGILTVGIVTKPFAFEGKRKMNMAEIGIAGLLERVDSLIVIPNERLKLISQEKITLLNAFEAADNVLRQGVQSISSADQCGGLHQPGLRGRAQHHEGRGLRPHGRWLAPGARTRRRTAANAAIASPLLETSISRRPRRYHQHHLLAGHRPGGCGAGRHPSSPVPLIPMRTSSGAPPSTRTMNDEMCMTVIATGFDAGLVGSDPMDVPQNAATFGGKVQVAFKNDTAPVAPAQPVQPVAPTQPVQPAPAVEEDDNSYFDDILGLLNNRGNN